jgi:hypothetical protein
MIFKVVVAIDTSEELSWHYSQWLTWDYLTQVPENICGLLRCGLLEVSYDSHNEPHVMMVTFKFMNDPNVVIKRIVNSHTGSDFEYNIQNFSHIQYFLDQLRRIITEHDQEKYSYDETDFPQTFTA